MRMLAGKQAKRMSEPATSKPATSESDPRAAPDYASSVSQSSTTATNVTAEAHIAALLEKMAAYVEGEAEISIEDYRLLRAMNLAAAERYSSMAESSAGLVAFAQRLQSKCDAMAPQLTQVRGQRSLESRAAPADTRVVVSTD